MPRRLPPVLAVLVLYLLHQDLWFWRTARPLVFGFLPVGLAWHGAYCLAVSILMLWLTRVAWPAHLEVSEVSPAGGAPPELERRRGDPADN